MTKYRVFSHYWRRPVGGSAASVALCAAAALLLASAPARSAAPVLDQLYPAAVQRGTTNTVTAVGKFDPWPPSVWIDVPGVRIEPQTNQGRFVIEVAAQAPLGVHAMRLFNPQGASQPRGLVISDEPESIEREPNDDAAALDVVQALPARINGRLEKSGDVDSFAVHARAGQTIVASLQCYVLASPVDAALRWVDARGVSVAFNHDAGGTLDPFLAYTAPADGRYAVQVFGFAYPADASVRLTGNEKCIYRLHVSGGSYARHTVPLGVRRHQRNTVRLVGWNLPPPEETILDAAALTTGDSARAWRPPGCDNALELPLGDGPEWTEEQSAGSTNLPPWAVTGCIAKPGERDRFAFHARKGESFAVLVQSAVFGFPLDAWLAIEDVAGKPLTREDDSAGADPSLTWTAGEDGVYGAVVGSVLRRGGGDHLYRLVVQRAVPAFRATVSEHALGIEPGKTNEIKLTVKRSHGHVARLSGSIRGLPAGVAAEPVEAPEKAGEIKVKLIAATDAAPFSGPIQIALAPVDSPGSEERLARVEFISSGSDNGVPNGYSKLLLDSTDRLWLTVLPATAPPAKTEVTK